MISPEECKLALIIQTHQLKEELDNLKRQDYKESQLHTYTDRRVYLGFMDLIENLHSNGK